MFEFNFILATKLLFLFKILMLGCAAIVNVTELINPKNMQMHLSPFYLFMNGDQENDILLSSEFLQDFTDS